MNKGVSVPDRPNVPYAVDRKEILFQHHQYNKFLWGSQELFLIFLIFLGIF